MRMGKTSKGRERERERRNAPPSRKEGGAVHKHQACLAWMGESLEILRKFWGRCGLKLLRDGRGCVEVEVERGLQAHHESLRRGALNKSE